MARHEVGKNLARAEAAEIGKHLPQRLWSSL